MRKIIPLVLALAFIFSLPLMAFADDGQKMTSEEYYTLGASEDTFKGLYNKMLPMFQVIDDIAQPSVRK